MKKVILFLCTLALLSCFGKAKDSAPSPILHIPADTTLVMPIFAGGIFHNPWYIPPVKSNPLRIFGMLSPKKNITKPKGDLPMLKVDIERAFPEDCLDGLHITWLGHASFLVQIDGVRIMIDPVFTHNLSPVFFFPVKRFQKEFLLSEEEIPYIDAVFITHSHRDHLDEKTIRRIHENVGVILVSSGVRDIVLGWGVPPDKVREYTWWQEDYITSASGERLDFAYTPARHFSARWLHDRNQTLWGSWVIIGRKHRLFHSGDTSYANHFEQIGRIYGEFDVTLIENGQYNESWRHSHVFPEEGVQAHIDLGGKYMFPMHWGSFDLSVHDWWEPITRVVAEASERGIRLLTPVIGESITICDDTKTSQWWTEWIPHQ